MIPAVEVKKLTHYYQGGNRTKVTAIDDISFTVEKGELLGIIGHTGSGKSTLIQHLNGLLKPDSGEILVDGKSIWESKETLRQSRFKVGLCFQYPEYQLFEETVFKDISFGPKNMKLSDAEIKERVINAAKFVGLSYDLLNKSPFDLSGGEKRRAAIAGVMAMNPEVLVLDEPAAGLDPLGRSQLIEMIREYRCQTGSTVILVSHNMEDIAMLADRVLVLNKGTVAMHGTVDEVYSKGKELRQMGLNVPEITEVFALLRQKGFDLPANVYSVEKAVSCMKALIEGRASR